MDFHAEFHPRGFESRIAHHQKLLLAGSCFTEQIGNRLMSNKFEVLLNPNVILFNPVSLVQSLQSYIHPEPYLEDDLFYHNELWSSWHHHTRFSGMDKEEVLLRINSSQQKAHHFLKQAGWLLITLGSAFVYEKNPATSARNGYGDVVANCHKIPPDKFRRRLLSTGEITELFQSLLNNLASFNPGLKIIFTISPVRHLREGFVENNRSKAALIQAVHNVVNEKEVYYFPAYELIMDDLRDYRFYAEDMVHPNYAATNYVWEKFVCTCIDPKAIELMKEIAVINAAVNHKPFNPGSEQHKKFKQTSLEKINALMRQHHYLHFDKEIAFLSS